MALNVYIFCGCLAALFVHNYKKVVGIDTTISAHKTSTSHSAGENDPNSKGQHGNSKSTSTSAKPLRQEFEEDDNIESYIKHMSKKGVQVGHLAPPTHHHDGEDSDEEVYRTAKAIDAANAHGSNAYDDETGGGGGNKEIEPLPPVDHSTITYSEFSKDLYDEHDDIRNLSEADVNRIRRELDMRVTGLVLYLLILCAFILISSSLN
jgi:hypothetical protein